MNKFKPEEGEEITFLEDLKIVHKLHDVALREGGVTGILDEGQILSALARAQNAYLYEGEEDLVKLASYLLHGVSQAHGYRDANKRTALLCAVVFLEMNGIELIESVPEWGPGEFIDGSFKSDQFSLDSVYNFLSPRCGWIEE